MNVEDLEFLVGESLRAADRPVDVVGGRDQLRQHVAARRTARRRIAAVAAAAAVLVAAVTVPLFLSTRDDTRDDRPVQPRPTRVQLSPSGLPVGLLEGIVARTTTEGGVSTVRLRVRPDGSGTFSGGAGKSDSSPGTYDVDYVRLGPGRAALRYQGPVCAAPRALTIGFVVRGHAVIIRDVSSSGCMVSTTLTTDLVGATLRILPLPQEISPSGLPVGLLEGTFDHPASQFGSARLQFYVRADGTGQYYGGETGEGDFSLFDVSFAGEAPGRAVMTFRSTGCPDTAELTLAFTVTMRTVRLGQVSSTGCLVSKELAADMSGGILQIRPLPVAAAQ